SYIKQHGLYKTGSSKISNFKTFTDFCAQSLFDKKGIAVKAYDIQSVSSSSDYTLIASGTSTRHASSMAENLVKAVKDEFNVYPLSVEGIDEGRWVVVDYGALIIHLFYDFVRQEYRLEDLWKTGTELKLVDNTAKSLQ
ncbi:MAG: ribosome silencing factor, partial [Pseudobdellovibrio sp.]